MQFLALIARALCRPTALRGKDHCHDYLRWPDVAEVLRRTCRRNLRTGRLETEVTYGLTSFSQDVAGPVKWEQLWRGHWTIENRVHYVRDVTLGEDRHQLWTGAALQALVA